MAKFEVQKSPESHDVELKTVHVDLEAKLIHYKLGDSSPIQYAPLSSALHDAIVGAVAAHAQDHHDAEADKKAEAKADAKADVHG